MQPSNEIWVSHLLLNTMGVAIVVFLSDCQSVSDTDTVIACEECAVALAVFNAIESCLEKTGEDWLPPHEILLGAGGFGDHFPLTLATVMNKIIWYSVHFSSQESVQASLHIWVFLQSRPSESQKAVPLSRTWKFGHTTLFTLQLLSPQCFNRSLCFWHKL